MEELQKWFQTKNYANGLRLYENIIGNDATFKFLILGENSVSKRKMNAAFEQLLEKSKSVENSKKEVQQVRKDSILPSDSKLAPIEIKNLVEERIQLYNASRAAHEKMKLMVEAHGNYTNEQRAELCKLIKRSFNRIKEIWKQTDYFDKNLQVMPKLNVIPVESLEMSMNFLIKRRNTLRCYLAPSYRVKLNAEKIAKYEQELEQIEAKLIENEHDIQVITGFDKNSQDFNNAYQKGLIMTKAKIQKSIITLAENGSAPAQAMADKLIRQAENKR